jgi:hypothetical protein
VIGVCVLIAFESLLLLLGWVMTSFGGWLAVEIFFLFMNDMVY